MYPLRGGTQYRTYKAATAKLATWLGQSVSDLGFIYKDGFAIAHFRHFTDRIVNVSPSIDVPREVVNLAKEAFTVRQERAALLQGTDVESDQRHQQFHQHSLGSIRQAQRPLPSFKTSAEVRTVHYLKRK